MQKKKAFFFFFLHYKMLKLSAVYILISITSIENLMSSYLLSERRGKKKKKTGLMIFLQPAKSLQLIYCCVGTASRSCRCIHPLLSTGVQRVLLLIMKGIRDGKVQATQRMIWKNSLSPSIVTALSPRIFFQGKDLVEILKLGQLMDL